MYDYKLLEAFTSVIENGGFEKAASALYITQSAVSQRIRALEEQEGQILLIRGNPPTPTETGKKLMAHYKKVRMLESEFSSSISHLDRYTTISIGLNADSLSTWFFDAVHDAVVKNNILLDLRVDDQEETHRMLKDGEVAGCITTREKPFQSCTCTYIGSMTYRMYASPDVYKRHFSGKLSADVLKGVPVIIYNSRDTLHLQMFERAFAAEPAEYPKMYIPSVDQYLDAVKRGYGIGMMPDNQCADLLVSGELKDAFSPHTVKTPLYWHRWSIKSSALDSISKALSKKHMLI